MAIATNTSRVVIYIIKVLEFLSRAILATFFLLISFTQPVVNKTFILVYAFEISFFGFANLMSILLKNKKKIFRTISILVLVNKKVFLKN